MTRHYVRATRKGWRCTCGAYMESRDTQVVRAAAESHAETFSGTVEVAGFYGRGAA